MSRIGRSEISHGEILSVDEVLARTDAVTLETATEAAREVLGRPMALAVIGPFEPDAFDGVVEQQLVTDASPSSAAPPSESAAAHHAGSPR
jgi:predicted Zn-dependent peptidase